MSWIFFRNFCCVDSVVIYSICNWQIGFIVFFIFNETVLSFHWFGLIWTLLRSLFFLFNTLLVLLLINWFLIFGYNFNAASCSSITFFYKTKPKPLKRYYYMIQFVFAVGWKLVFCMQCLLFVWCAISVFGVTRHYLIERHWQFTNSDTILLFRW